MTQNLGISVSAEPIPEPEQIVREYGALVSTLCRRMIQDRDGAEEAALEVWCEVLKGLPGYRGEARFSTWLTAVAKRTIWRWIEREQRHEQKTFIAGCRDTTLPSPEEVGRNDPEKIELWSRMLCDVCLTAALHCLEPETRFIFLLRATLKMDYREIARVMEMDYAAVRQRCSRARRKMERFAGEDCALVNPFGKCRCGQRGFLEETRLLAEFKKLQRLSRGMEAWASAERAFPKVDYWRSLL